MQINGWDRGAVKPLTAFLPSDYLNYSQQVQRKVGPS